MKNSYNFVVKFCISLMSLCFLLSAAQPSNVLENKSSEPISSDMNKMLIVVALPFRPNLPFDPHWYNLDYVSYIADFLPSENYNVTEYFVSLENIPLFLDNMTILYKQMKNICVLNFCDGGEWDGYPGISLNREWEKHPISKLIPISGANAQFIFNSDDKAKMQSYISQANLKFLPQALISSQMIAEADLITLLASQRLDCAWPLFCKLNIGAGALGISASSVCHNIKELIAQIQKVHSIFPNSDILIQPYLAGPEYTILVLKDRVYAAVRRDFHNFYNLMEEEYLTNSNATEDEITYYPTPEYVQKLALKAIQAIPGTHHYTRVDLRDDGKGNTYVLDINDRPAFGNPSTVKCMLDYLQLSEAQLLLDIIETCSFAT